MPSKAELKYLKSLSRKKYRKENKQFIVEGYRAIKELLNSNQKIEKMWATENFLLENSDFKEKINSIDFEFIKTNDLSSILNTQSPQHIMALVSIENNDESILNKGNVLILDNISDPGNMGTLLRTAVWYGIENIFCSRDCVDIYNPKVVRSAMGAHFHIKNLYHTGLLDLINDLKKKDYMVIGASLDGSSYKNFDISSDDWALVLGNEAHGIRKEIIAHVHDKISIPAVGSIESLNVAVAGSIILDRLIN